MAKAPRNAMDPADLAWVAVDWGTSNLRAWALDAHDRVLATCSAPRGMATLAPAQYEGVLLEAIGAWLGERRLPVLICGMAGARQGWVEAPYVPVTQGSDALAALADHLIAAPTHDQRLRGWIVPGLCRHPTGDDGAFDVMRGEETQLLGLLSHQPTFTGAVCLPGTHAKWARLDSGRMQRFSTYLTGELYSVLRDHTVLAHSVEAGADATGAFLAGVDAAIADPARFSAELFGIRARDLLDPALPADRASHLDARLSGLVLGLELADATAMLDRGAPLALIGSDTLCHRYQQALAHLGRHPQCHAAETMTLAGLGRIRQRL